MENYMENHQISKYRYERKYILKPIDLPCLFFDLNLKGYREIFDERKINNLYFDSFDLSSVMDNVNGLSERKKYRIRWYGDSFSNSLKQLEIKSKAEFLNAKKTIQLEEFTLKGLNDIEKSSVELIKFLKKDNLSLFNHFQSKTVKLFNSYNRRYFLSKNNETRITIDSSLNFYSPVTKNIFEENNIIVEIKYFRDFNESFKNLTLNKYSKYVKGVLSTTFFNPIY